MRNHRLNREQRLEAPLETVFEFFSVARNLELITPKMLRFELLTPEPIEMAAGITLDYRLRVHGVPFRWRSVIDEWEPGVAFVDRQLKGPYAQWVHRHEFEAVGDQATIVRDQIDCRLPLSPLGDVALPLVRRDLKQIFDFRRSSSSRLLEASQ